MPISGYLLEIARKIVREIEEKSAKDIEYQTSSALLMLSPDRACSDCQCMLITLT